MKEAVCFSCSWDKLNVSFPILNDILGRFVHFWLEKLKTRLGFLGNALVWSSAVSGFHYKWGAWFSLTCLRAHTHSLSCPWEPPSSEDPVGPILGTTLGPFSGGHLDMDRCHSPTNLQAPSPGTLEALGSLLTLSEGAEIWDEVESFPISSPGSLLLCHPWKHLDLCCPIW